MGGEKRKHQDQGGGAASGKRVKKRNFYSEASKGRSNNGEIRGPGIWITCERRKEAKSVTEAYDLLNEVELTPKSSFRLVCLKIHSFPFSTKNYPQIADKLYPETISDTLTLPDGDGSLKDDDESIEAQIARELEGLKPNSPNRRKTRFTSIKTNTECRQCAPATSMSWGLILVSLFPYIQSYGYHAYHLVIQWFWSQALWRTCKEVDRLVQGKSNNMLDLCL